MRKLRNLEFWLNFSIIHVTVLLIILTYFRELPLNFTLGPYRFTHWLGWIGMILIAVFTPMFYVLSARATLNKYGNAYQEYMKRTPRWIGIPRSSKSG